jgi:hypothetical protein
LGDAAVAPEGRFLLGEDRMKLNPQEKRVLDALRFEGSRGITRVDFSAPHVHDGGDPIQNFPARIHSLIHTHGYEIVKDGKRNACTIYKLRQEPRVVVDAEPTASGATLFESPTGQRLSAYFGDAA